MVMNTNETSRRASERDRESESDKNKRKIYIMKQTEKKQFFDTFSYIVTGRRACVRVIICIQQ